MPDDLTLKKPENPMKINITQSWETKYWARQFGVSERQIQIAVAAVGPTVKDVKRYLGIDNC